MYIVLKIYSCIVWEESKHAINLPILNLPVNIVLLNYKDLEDVLML